MDLVAAKLLRPAISARRTPKFFRNEQMALNPFPAEFSKISAAAD
jgi:hypothetical protein